MAVQTPSRGLLAHAAGGAGALAATAPLVVVSATCMVRVSRPMIRAKRNSFQDMMKAKTEATKTPGRIRGSEMKNKI